MREKLIEYRGNRTQTEMAEKFGVCQQAWQKWENGTVTPRPRIMKLISIDSGLPMEVLFDDVFNNTEKLNEGAS